MEIKKIPPSAGTSADAYPIQNTEDSPAVKTKQVAKPAFKNFPLIEERPFSNTATLKEDLEPLSRRIAELTSGTHLMTSMEVKGEIARCKRGLESLQDKLEMLEFGVEFPLMSELNPRQPDSFASNILRNARRILEGE